MSTSNRPVSVLIISCLYITVGAVGFTYHFPELITFKEYAVWIELTELLAIIAGAFMLLNHNWARWLAIAWMAFHVAISFPVLRQMAEHSIIFAVIAWLLFRPGGRRRFASSKLGDE